MKRKDWEQLKIKPLEELKKNLAEFRDRLWNLRTDLAAGKIKNVKEIKQVKKTIARILTVIGKSK